MSYRFQPIRWSERKPVAELIRQAQEQHVDHLVAQANPNVAVVDSTTFSSSSSDLTAFRNSFQTQHWSRLSDCLPATVYFLAVPPTDHSAVAINVSTVVQQQRFVDDSQSLAEFVVRFAESATVSFVDNVQTAGDQFSLPKLTLVDSGRSYPWLRERIQQVSGTKKASSSTSLTAMKAGLFLLNDFFDDSHSCSQSIEGLGPHHTGDYWHAILHRREPDYGNAKYWFRHVGRHPAYVGLAQVAERHFATSGTLASNLQPWKTRLITNSDWDALAFVDLCEAAAKDVELRGWCEQVQYDEMLLLLESTANEAFR
jgi:hypothetical protein